MNGSRSLALVCFLVLLTCCAATRGNVVIDTVPIGNPGNPGDTRYPSGGVPSFGGVGYTYNIGKYEVTAGQYTAFLNAVAATDTYGLYNTNMGSMPYRGANIQRAGSPGNYTYTVGDGTPADVTNWANRPVNYVNWGDAARFANWLHNNQPTGTQNLTTTEDGAYFLNGATTDAQLLAVNREADWRWAITSEDEWYKAAYHKNDGVTGNYFDYPTSTNSMPSNVLGDPTDPGNNATYYDNGYTIGSPYFRTEVGAHENSDSPYGTFDQAGNVWEWNEAILYTLDSGWYRALRSGSFSGNGYNGVHARDRVNSGVAGGYDAVGFRVVQVPEPASLTLLAMAGPFLWRRAAEQRWGS